MNDLDKDSLRQGVYDIVKCIPRGRATSYGAIAKAAGYSNLSRMVGKIMAGCSNKNIPAHRVVISQVILSVKDAFGSAGEMKKLLEAEGLVVKNDRIVNWKTVFWNPLKEIRME